MIRDTKNDLNNDKEVRMRLKKLLYPVVFIMTIVFMLAQPFYTEVRAASTPAARKKKVTLYTDSEAYTIKFKNVSKKAVIKYSSSNKSVVTVKKGVVTPKGAGKATVTAKITQNNNTYKVKVKFTVLEAEKTVELPDYDALAAERQKELESIAVRKENTILNLKGAAVAATSQEISDTVYSHANKYSIFYLYPSKLSLLRSEKEYMDMFPAISDLKFTEVVFYKNAIMVKVTSVSPWGGYEDEYAIDSALSTGNTSYLSDTELSLYNKITALSKELKGSDEYETVKNIHDHLVLNIAYPSSWSGMGVHTADYALNKGVCVCDGYSKAFYFLCKASGIESVLVRGNAINSSGRNESHAWNKVKINKKWYNADVTWDDPTPDVAGQIKYFYFLITDKDISANHSWDNTGFPEAVSTDLAPIYKEFADTVRLSGSSEVSKYISSSVSEAYASHFTCELEFLDSTSDNSVAETVKTLLNKYNRENNCGYNYSSESAGIFGRLYKIKIYK